MLTKETITKKDREQLRFTIEAILKYGKSKWHNHFGEMLFTFKTEKGYPPDMLMDGIEKENPLSKEEKVYMVHVFQTKMMEHNLKAGLGEGQQKKQQDHNREVIQKIIDNGIFEE